MADYHVPVLLNEVITNLNVQPGMWYIDATTGGGGHSEAILKHGGKVIGIDQDPEALVAARRRLTTACPNASWQLALGNFDQLEKLAKERGINNVSGILFDLGVSSHQLEMPARGFSFNLEGPLDMRMSPDLKVTAADLVNGLNEGELNELFCKLGEEIYSRRIAKAICRARELGQIITTNQLVKIILTACPRQVKFDHIHPATRCFQALRIAVNDELNNLKIALPQAISLLQTKGRLLVISFHSGEDKIVKNFMKDNEKQRVLTIINKDLIRPTAQEVSENPRSRSARLRVAQKI